MDKLSTVGLCFKICVSMVIKNILYIHYKTKTQVSIQYNDRELKLLRILALHKIALLFNITN